MKTIKIIRISLLIILFSLFINNHVHRIIELKIVDLLFFVVALILLSLTYIIEDKEDLKKYSKLIYYKLIQYFLDPAALAGSLVVVLTILFTINDAISLITLDSEHTVYFILLILATLASFIVLVFSKNTENYEQIKLIINRQYPYISFIKQVKNSEYDFIPMLEKAQKSIFVIGPNLNFIANKRSEICLNNKTNIKYDELTDNECRKLDHIQLLTDLQREELDEQQCKIFLSKYDILQKLYIKLDKNKDFKVRFLLSDLSYNENVGNLVAEYAFTDTYVNELIRATCHLILWKKCIKPPQVEIKKTPIITSSILFIDEGTENAKLLVTPIPPKIPGGIRPSFLIEKQKHPDEFYTYFYSYNRLFEDSPDITKIENEDSPYNITIQNEGVANKLNIENNEENTRK